MRRLLLALLIAASAAFAGIRTYPPPAGSGTIGSSGPLANEYIPFGDPALVNGLIHYYKMEASSSPWVDSVGTSNLTLLSGAATSTAGKRDNAIVRSSGSVALSTTTGVTDIRLTTNITVAFWWRSDNGSYGFSNVYYFDTGFIADNHEVFIYDSGGNQVWSRMYNTVGSTVTASLAVTPGAGVWNHILAEFDISAKTTTIRYNNSTSNTSGVLGGTIRTNGTRLVVFNVATDPQQKLDEMGIWNRILTAGERTSLYNSGAGRFY